MIITRTPFRVSFAGGGSDLESFYKLHTGCVLSTTINKYMYISVHPYFDEKMIQLKYSETEKVQNIEDIKHSIFKQVLGDFKAKGIEITSTADVPAGTGLGSSSAFTVGLLHSLYSYNGKYVAKERLANEACEIEINKLKNRIGKQDQYAVAQGGLNFIEFLSNGNVVTTPVILKSETYNKLEQNLLMFYTGDIRSANKILIEQDKNMKKYEKFNYVIKLTDLCRVLKKALESEQIGLFGEILNEGWQIKKKLAGGISNAMVDHYYSLAIKNGAKGGKLLGAGGGGFLLFYVEKENHDKIRNALKDLKELKFRFDNGGSKVIHVGQKYW